MMTKTTLPRDVVCAIGRVVVNFQHLEFTIVRLIWIMAAADEEIGQRITACVMFSKLLDLLTSVFLYRVQAPNLVKQFESLISRARSVSTNRNRIVHSWWFTSLDGTEPSRLKLSPKGTQDGSDIDMDALSVEISNLANDFDMFINELYDAKLIRKKPGISLESLT